MNAITKASDESIFADLNHMLTQLSDHKVVEIAGLFDRGGVDPKALKGRAILRDRLRALRPPRRITPCRLFCTPFEMLLSDDQAPEDPLRQIARAAIMPAWQQVERRLSASVVKEAARAGEDAASPMDEALRPAAAALWDESSRIMEDAFDEIARQVGDPEWLRQIGGAMKAHEPIMALRTLLAHGGRPNPGAELGRQIAALVHDAAQIGEDAAYAAALTASLHFESPGAVIAALLDNKIGTKSRAGAAVLRRLSETMIRDIDWHSRSMIDIAGEANPLDLVASLEDVADNVQALLAFSGKDTDPKLRMQIKQANLRARSIATETVLPAMRDTFQTNLEKALGSGEAGSRAAGRMVEDALTGLRRVRLGADALGAGDETNAVIDNVLQAVKAQAKASPGEQGTPDYRKRVTLLARYVELIEGSEAARACLADWLAAKAA